MSWGWKGPQGGKKIKCPFSITQATCPLPDQLFTKKWFLLPPTQHHDYNVPFKYGLQDVKITTSADLGFYCLFFTVSHLRWDLRDLAISINTAVWSSKVINGIKIQSCPPGSSVHEDFSRPESWSGLPCPSPGDLPNPRIKMGLLHCIFTI